MRRTKILATIGPATESNTTLRSLLLAGAEAVRINLAHGSSEEHRSAVRRIRAVARRQAREVAVVADVPGPKLRIGALEGPIELVRGHRWRLDRRTTPGDLGRVGVELPAFRGVARRGDPVLLGDGAVELRVVRADDESIETVVEAPGRVASHAGIYLPRAKLRTTPLGPVDRALAKEVLEEGVDYLALSFVRNASDLRSARSWLAGQPTGRGVGLIAKIERAEALDAIDGILDETDGIMVARGDLGIELPLERLALEQKRLVRRANVAGKFAIVATQMLLSMLSSPRPTRAEATDVANAVLDGADAVMLSEESAVGRYPVDAVRWLARIADATEATFDPRPIREARETSATEGPEGSVAAAAVQLAEDVGARAIVTPTHSGRTARLVAAEHPKCPVLALSRYRDVRRRLALVGGVHARAAPERGDLPSLIDSARRILATFDLGPTGPAVLTAGYPVEGRPTNLLTLIDPIPRPAGRRRT